MKITTDVRYRPDSDRGFLDVYLPDTPAPYPVVV